MARKMLNGCLVVLAAFLCPLSVIAVTGAFSLIGALAGPSDADIEATVPESVPADAPFPITVSIANTGDEAQTLHSIDLTASAPDAVEVLRTAPAFSGTTLDGTFHTYEFGNAIAPAETLEVTLDVVIHETGNQELQLGVCANSQLSCNLLVTEIEVR